MRDIPAGFTTRFAPAPTGYLHLGHAVNAVWTWGMAGALGGRVWLRIEDHDRGRCRPEYEDALLEDIAWLGVEPAGFSRQSDRSDRYGASLATLEAAGLAYPCICTRSNYEGRYPGTCRERGIDPDATAARRVVMGAMLRAVGAQPHSSIQAPSATRRDPVGAPGDALEHFVDLRLGPQSQDPAGHGDVLVRDGHGNWTYQFAVVVDDLEQGVDLVIRGEDILNSTGRQLRLARLLGREHPPRFLHHPLVRHPDGRKLSKSSNDTGLRDLRAAGRTSEQVLGLATQLGDLQAEATPVSVAGLADLVSSWIDEHAAASEAPPNGPP